MPDGTPPHHPGLTFWFAQTLKTSDDRLDFFPDWITGPTSIPRISIRRLQVVRGGVSAQVAAIFPALQVTGEDGSALINRVNCGLTEIWHTSQVNWACQSPAWATTTRRWIDLDERIASLKRDAAVTSAG